MATFDELFYGIAQQESGGNYKSVNAGSGALGKYQIMPANIPSWSKQYMGTQWTARQFLSDPNKQESLAKAVLKHYYDKWGARGAASAWYSGDASLNLNYNKQHGGPSVGSYVDQVLGKGMGYPGTPGTAYVEPAAPAVTTVDNRVRPQAEAMKAPTSSGMGAVTAPGVDAFDGTAPAPGSASGTPVAVGPSAPPVAGASSDPAGGSSLPGRGFAEQMKILQAQFPGMKMTSGFRPGAITANGTVSWHAKGRAVDLPGSMAVFNWLRKTYGATSKELIYTPAGNKQIKNGKAMTYAGKDAANHEGHIHWAY